MTNRWIRDLFIIPIVVGVVVAGFQFGVPYFFNKGKELSYIIEEPEKYLSDPVIGHVNVTVNNVSIRNLYAYKVKIWNSGRIPVKNMAVRLSFQTDNKDFKVFSTSHTTKPELEFGEITEEFISTNQKRFKYELLNSGDEDKITLLANQNAKLKLFGKLEGLSFKKVEPTKTQDWLSLGMSLFSMLAAFFALLMNYGVKKLKL